jgi:hypothetical protein
MEKISYTPRVAARNHLYTELGQSHPRVAAGIKKKYNDRKR